MSTRLDPSTAAACSDAAAAAQALRQAMLRPEADALEALLAEDLWYAHSSGRIDDKRRVVADLLTPVTRFLRLDTESEHLHLMANVAVIRHRVGVTFEEQSAPVSLRLLTLQVWHRQSGLWRLQARQATRLPDCPAPAYRPSHQQAHSTDRQPPGDPT